MNVQKFVQGILEEQVSEFLRQRRSKRRSLGDSGRGNRNRFGRPRKLTLGCGTIEVGGPRLETPKRGQRAAYPHVCPKEQEVDQLILELYLHGLAEGASTWLCGACYARR